MQIISTIAGSDTAAYLAAVDCAERRAFHSFFDQHVIEDEDIGYIPIDEGDYILERVKHVVEGLNVHLQPFQFRRRRAASSMSFCAVCGVSFWKACSTSTRSGSLAGQITRNALDSSRTRILRTPGPTVFIGFQSSGSFPNCTSLN